VCFNDKYIENTSFGQKVAGPGLSVLWYTGPTWLAYYSYFSVALMTVFMVFGFWRPINKKNHKRISFMAWQMSIYLTAFATSLAGISRLSLVMAVIHNGCESYMCYAVLCLLVPTVSKTAKVWFIIGSSVYVSIELIVMLSVPILDSVDVVVAMGFVLDLASLIGWIVCWRRHRIRIWPVLGFFCHFMYVILFLLNCFFVPYGRIAGLALNTAAIGLASLPTGFSWDEQKQKGAAVQTPSQEVQDGTNPSWQLTTV